LTTEQPGRLLIVEYA